MNKLENKNNYKSSPKLFNYRTWGPKTLKFEGRKAVINSNSLSENNLNAAKYHYIRTKEEKKNKRPIFTTTDEEKARYAFQKALLKYKSNKSNKNQVKIIYYLLFDYYKNFLKNNKDKKEFKQFQQAINEFKPILESYLNSYKPNITHIKYNNKFFNYLSIKSNILINYKKKIDMYEIKQNFIKYEYTENKNNLYIITIFNKLYNYYNNFLKKTNELKINDENFNNYLYKFKDIITKKYPNKMQENIINLLTKKNNLNKITFLKYILNISQKKKLIKLNNLPLQSNIVNFPNNKIYDSISNALMAYYKKVDIAKATEDKVDKDISNYKKNFKKMISKLEQSYKMKFPEYKNFKISNVLSQENLKKIFDIQTNYKIGISPNNL